MQLLYRASGLPSSGELDERELAALYRPPARTGGAGWVRSNFVTSLDGSTQGADGRSGSINTASDHHVFALHRAHADAVLVGAQTVRSEGYRAVDLEPWQRRLRERDGRPGLPALVVVTRSLDVDPSIIGHGDREVGPVLVVTTEGADARRVAALEDAGIEVVRHGERDVDLTAALAGLARRGYREVLCEGGARLHRDLLAADLLDELSLTLAPLAVGGAGHRTTAGDPLADEPAFRLGSALLADDGTLFVNYLRAR